jgi:L-threonylcarbamoyladenylate synthase
MFLTPDDVGMDRAAELLRAGEIVAVPTETVYGLAANALDAVAVRKIFEAKGRPFIDPLIVHVADLAMAEELAESAPLLGKLAEYFWPGPLTVILKKRANVPDLVTAGEPTVAIRIPAHPVMRELIRRSGLPLAAPSANPFGYVSPTTAGHVRDSLGAKAPFILDGGPCAHGVESTIVNLADPEGVRILRPGPVTLEQLESALGVPVLPAPSHLDQKAAQAAPGMLDRHYSPDTPLVLRTFGSSPEIPAGFSGRVAVVHQARPDRVVGDGAEHFWFSESGAPDEVARSLFALIRHLDTQKFAVILAEAARPGGLGDAINDRLKRAAAKR